MSYEGLGPQAGKLKWPVHLLLSETDIGLRDSAEWIETKLKTEN